MAKTWCLNKQTFKIPENFSSSMEADSVISHSVEYKDKPRQLSVLNGGQFL